MQFTGKQQAYRIIFGTWFSTAAAVASMRSSSPVSRDNYLTSLMKLLSLLKALGD